jgi:hypothetical protein
MARQHHGVVFDALLLLLLTAPIDANQISGRDTQRDEIRNPRDRSLRAMKVQSSHIKLVGTIQCPGQTQSSMSWSPEGSFLATSTGQNVSVWRLPGLRTKESIARPATFETSTGKLGVNLGRSDDLVVSQNITGPATSETTKLGQSGDLVVSENITRPAMFETAKVVSGVALIDA